MKSKLLLFFGLASLTAQAQSPITSFTPNAASEFNLFTPGNALNQAPQGDNAAWSFTGLVALGTASYETPAPTAGEISNYPSTTGKLRHVEVVEGVSIVTDIFYKAPGNNVSITGVESDGFTINYNSNNANIGIYPLAYGYNATDAVAGNYVYDTYSGTFSGNITTTVDAYGTISTNINPTPTAVTRMKTTQNLSMNYGIFPNVGTFNQTIWDYFTAGSSDPLVRVTTTSITIPLLSINDVSTIVELLDTELQTKSWASDRVTMSPNPVKDVLTVKAAQPVQSVQLTDLTGKVVLTARTGEVNVSALPNGVYLATVVTDAGTQTQKIIKQ